MACHLVRTATHPKGACKEEWNAFQRMLEWKDAVLRKGTGGAEWTPKPTILVVDDEVAYCDAAADMLEVFGYRALKANSARQAKAVLEVDTPNAILLDVMMPEIDGLTLLAELASNPRFLGIPLVMVSAKAMPADISNAWMAGADAYLCKPYTADELREVVQHVLALPSNEPHRSGGTDRLRIVLKNLPPDRSR